MKTFKGTKGEWEVYEANPKMVLTDLGAYKPNAMMLSICSKKEMLANAKAISQVPNMIEALQHSLRVAETLPNRDSVGVKMLIKNLEETLNKAL